MASSSPTETDVGNSRWYCHVCEEETEVVSEVIDRMWHWMSVRRGYSCANITTVHLVELFSFTTVLGLCEDRRPLNETTQLNRKPWTQVSNTCKSVSIFTNKILKTLSLYNFLRLVCNTSQIGAKIKLNCLVRPELLYPCFKCINRACVYKRIWQVIRDIYNTCREKNVFLNETYG